MYRTFVDQLNSRMGDIEESVPTRLKRQLEQLREGMQGRRLSNKVHLNVLISHCRSNHTHSKNWKLSPKKWMRARTRQNEHEREDYAQSMTPIVLLSNIYHIYRHLLSTGMNHEASVTSLVKGAVRVQVLNPDLGVFSSVYRYGFLVCFCTDNLPLLRLHCLTAVRGESVATGLCFHEQTIFPCPCYTSAV